MKRPQKRSKPKRRAMLAAAGTVDRDELQRMETIAVYRPSPYHKAHLLSGGRRAVPVPRPDKTICDGPSVGSHRNAIELLRAGFQRGMVSRQIRRGWPRNVWAVDEDSVVYEAQLSNVETGEYHGYPMKQGDGFAAFIAAELGEARSMTLSIDAEWCRSPGDEAAASPGPMETEDEATLGRIAVTSIGSG